MAPLAMEMVRDIDEDTVDFAPNYDGRTAEPTILPSRFPNLLVNGQRRHRRRYGHQHPAPQPARGGVPASSGRSHTPRPNATELLEALLERVQGPDFPTGSLIVGDRGIDDAYRTGRGLITMRAVVEVEEIQNRNAWSSRSCRTR